MADTPPIMIVLVAIYIVFLLAIAIFLTIRAIQTKHFHLLVLCASFLGMILDFLMIFLQVHPLILNLLVNACWILLVIFTYLTFEKGKMKPFIYILGLTVFFRMCDFFIRLQFGFTTPLASSLNSDTLVWYYLFQFAVRMEFTLSVGWLTLLSLRAYRKHKSSDIEPWIKRRYQILGIGALIFLLQTVFIFLLPTDGTGYSGSQGLAVGTVLLIISLVFGASQLLAWIMPQWLKRYFNKGFQAQSVDQMTEMSEEELMKQLLEED